MTWFRSKKRFNEGGKEQCDFEPRRVSCRRSSDVQEAVKNPGPDLG